MKKFKHKLTGFIAEWNPEGCNYILKEHRKLPEQLPLWVVENSNDWQEVKEPMFISYDGVEMYKGNDVYFVDNFELLKMVYVVNDWFKTATPNYKRFSTKEAALKYIDLHKPEYSKSDVIEALRIAEYYSGFRKPSGEEVIKHLFGE